jgi:hypothetical protein
MIAGSARSEAAVNGLIPYPNNVACISLEKTVERNTASENDPYANNSNREIACHDFVMVA